MTQISVVTISFNQARFLPAALQSIHGQKGNFQIQHVVVDPGSRDESRAVIDQWGDRVVRVYEADQGPPDGLNKGFARATGDILYFLNADDMVEPGAFAFAERFFAAHPDVDVLYGAGCVIDESGRRTKFLRGTYFSCEAYLQDTLNLVQQSFFFRRRAFQAVGGFNAANRVSWDGELFFRMKAAGLKFHAVSASLGLFRVYGGTITTSDGHMARRQAVRDRLRQEWQGRGPGRIERLMHPLWKLAKQGSALLICARTGLLHRRQLQECGLAVPPLRSVFSRRYLPQEACA